MRTSKEQGTRHVGHNSKQGTLFSRRLSISQTTRKILFYHCSRVAEINYLST